MLKRIILIFIMGLAIHSAQSQFRIENDTLYAYDFAGKTPSSFVDIIAHTRIYQTGIAPDLVQWVRSTNQLPDPAWESAVCDIVACRGTDVDTGSFLFDTGDSGQLSFHFYAKNVNASSKMIVRFSRVSNPLEYTDIVIFATAWKPVGINPIHNSVTSSIPNPAQNAITFNNNMIENGTLEVYNAVGQALLSMSFTNNMTVDIKDFAVGIYTVKIFDGSNSSFSRIIKE